MNLKHILKTVDNFNTNDETEDFEINNFFDEIGDKYAKLEELKYEEKELVIKSLFNFLKRQSLELEEVWSFIHLLESIDKPTYEIYDKELIKFNKETPTIMSVFLLNRFINSLEGEPRQKGINLLKEISENRIISELVSQEAKSFFDYQVDEK